MNQPVIVAAKRSAVGKFAGSLAALSAPQMGAQLIQQLLADARLQPDDVDEVIAGQVLTAGSGQNPARQAALLAGLPITTPALTINKVCGSGLKAVMLAAQAIKAGDAEVVIAGGQENMSAAAHVLPHSRTGQRMGDWALVDTMVKDGLWCAINDYHMGITAENIAERFNISREEQDHFALLSQQKAAAAQAAGKFIDEICPLVIQDKKGEQVFAVDEYIRTDASLDKIAAMRAAFKKDGTVTAANASGLNDGAAFVVVMSRAKAQALNLTPLASIAAYASAGVEPAIMGTGPIPASSACLQKAGWLPAELDLVEANEAFAAQAIRVNQGMGFDVTKVNVNGGAIALGHPIGASGCRILVSLLYEMQRRGAHKGLATLCIGGGQGVALALSK